MWNCNVNSDGDSAFSNRTLIRVFHENGRKTRFIRHYSERSLMIPTLLKCTIIACLLLNCALIAKAAPDHNNSISSSSSSSSSDDPMPTLVNDVSDIENLTQFVFKKHNVTSGHETTNVQGLLPALEDLLHKLKSKSFSSIHLNDSASCNNASMITSSPTNSNGMIDNRTSHHLCEVSKKQCLSLEDMISLVPNSSHSLSGVVSRLCPVLLFQQQLGSCRQKLMPEATQGDNANNHGKARPSPSEVWGYGILFVTLISCCSLVGVIILPILNKDLYFVVLMLFEGLAVGSLVGSAIFHLIPQAFQLLGQDAQHGYLWKSLIIFCGIYLFYFSEQCMKIIIQLRKKRQPVDPPTDEKIKPLLHPSNSNSSAINGIALTVENDVKASNHFLNGKDTTGNSHLGNGDAANSLMLPNSSSTKHSANGHSHHDHHVSFQPGQNGVGTVAWMIIFGDGLHNFIDGLSIGAAFSESVLAGISISVAVVCEEFPHELGDFAVLLSAGMSMRQAIVYNFLSACTCYLGLVFGILLGDLTEGSPYILALAGGMFLYIALVDMMGELNEGIIEANKNGVWHTVKVLLLQNIGILLGIMVLFLMARYSELINFDAVDNSAAATLLGQHDKTISSEHMNVESPNAFGF